MADREKVIYSIERCICHVPDACRDCGYDNHEYNECVEKLLRDALELLKEQEPVRPVLARIGNYAAINDYTCPECGTDLYHLQKYCDECGNYAAINDYTCPECGTDLYYLQKYCDECGRPVKWDE